MYQEIYYLINITLVQNPIYWVDRF